MWTAVMVLVAMAVAIAGGWALAKYIEMIGWHR